MVSSGVDRFIVGIDEDGFYICVFGKASRVADGLSAKEFQVRCKKMFADDCLVGGDDSIWEPSEFTDDPKMIKCCETLQKLFTAKHE